jgi:hypothetical protein
MLHFWGDLPATFGKVANHLLNRLCNFNCKRVDLVFDEIVTPLIKDIRGIVGAKVGETGAMWDKFFKKIVMLYFVVQNQTDFPFFVQI